VVVYLNGAPYVQPSGPYAGFYVSETSLENPRLPAIDPTRYLDARTTCYIVLPGGKVPEAGLGDLAIVFDPSSGRWTGAVYGDEGPGSECGEVSLATIKALGLPGTDGKSSPGELRDDLFYLVFPGSAHELSDVASWPYSPASVQAAAAADFNRWGGPSRVRAILQTDPVGGPVSDEVATAMSRWQTYAPPDEFSFANGGRRPCAVEAVVYGLSVVNSIERKIASKEQGSGPSFDRSGAARTLDEVFAVLSKFPDACFDKGIAGGQLSSRIEALKARISGLPGLSHFHPCR
jgi:hypothetical protein